MLHRIYDPESFAATATAFRFAGPVSRFDHHVKHEDGRGILYAAADFKGCLVEVYGNRGYGVAGERRHCGIRVSRALRLLELRGDGALRSGTIAQVSSGSHTTARRWSRYFYENTELYGVIDGIAYSNAHNEQTAFALYERAADAVANIEWDNRLDDRSRRDEYECAAREANLIVAFYIR
jgi:RES domain